MEQKKAAAGFTQAAALLGACIFLIFCGFELGPYGRGRISMLSFIGAFGFFSMSAAALNWALDARKSASWMSEGRVTLEPHGIRVQGIAHPWSTMRVEACTGTELLILEEGGNLKIPIDALEGPGSFREEVRKICRGQLNI